MFFQHGHPAGCVALDHEGLVVGIRVAVDGAGSEHAVEDAQELVGGGDGGAFVAAAHGEGLVVALALARVGTGGAVGALDEDAAQDAVALAGSAVACLPGAFVVAGAQARQPDAVGAVGLAPLELLDMLGMHQERFNTGPFERLEDNFPVHAGGRHQRGADLVAKQPAGQLAQTAGQGAEAAGAGLGLRIRPGQTHGRRDLHFVHVETGGAGMDDVQGISVYTV